MHSEAEQIKTLDLGAKNIYYKAKQGQWVDHAQKPEPLDGFREEFLKTTLG